MKGLSALPGVSFEAGSRSPLLTSPWDEVAHIPGQDGMIGGQAHARMP